MKSPEKFFALSIEQQVQPRFHVKLFKSTIYSLFLLILVFAFITGLHAQTGEIKGKIIDKDSKEDVPFASVHLLQEKSKNKRVASTSSDINGFYHFNKIPAGTYKLKVLFVGYEEELIRKITVYPDSVVVQHVELKASAEVFETVMIVDYDVDHRKQYKSGKAAGRVQGVYIQPYQQQNTEEYDGIIENRFISPIYHPLSTFSIDVDMASYSNVRRFLNEGDMPPADAIRTEEMINYFTYDYPAPQSEEPVAITTDLAECSWNAKHKIALIGLQAEKIETADLPPSNLVFLLDVSGSMQDQNKLPLLKKSLQLLVNNLRSNDRVAIVVYAGSSGLVLKSTRGNNKEKTWKAIVLSLSG